MFDDLTQEIEKKLAASLTAATTELLPYIPYLFQDLWDLGSQPDMIADLLLRNLSVEKHDKILDLACGKGAVSIRVAQKLGANVKGIDIFSEFILEASQRAMKESIADRCVFAVEDVNQSVLNEKNYDCTIFGAAGNILGTPQETVFKLKSTIRKNGFLVIDDVYLSENLLFDDVRYHSCEYSSLQQWDDIFESVGFDIVEAIEMNSNEWLSHAKTQVALIEKRADELSLAHPEKMELFKGYIASQHNECHDLENSLVGITWLLQSKR